jgi:hypothetical protein
MPLFIAGTRKLMALGIFLFPAFLLCAQTNPNPDSIPQGVIKVKRPPVIANYRVGLVYLYAESDRHARVTDASANQIVFSDSTLNPNAPHPLNEDLYFVSGTDSGRVGDGPSSLPFDWNKYLSSLKYTFLWTDSTRADSAQYVFTIDKKGNASCKPLPWKNADSTCRVFEDKTKSYATVLKRWFPAQQNKKIGSVKMRKVPCTVIVTIYAYDPNVGRILPVDTIIPATNILKPKSKLHRP